MKKLSCNEVYNKYKDILEKKIHKTNKQAKILTLRVGEDLGAISYERALTKQCRDLGLKIENIILEANAGKKLILSHIENANKNLDINGILLFQPMQGDYDKEDLNEILEKVSPEKDVDGATFYNLSKVLKSSGDSNTPATANAIHLFIKSEIADISGKNVLIINRSHVIGIPLFFLLERDDATVTVAHSKSKDIEDLMKDKDIIISAVGKSEIFKPCKLKENCMIIDMGISQNEDGEYTGDFSTDSLVDKNVSYLPSIGGIGKITRSIIIEHTLINYLGEEHGR